MADRKTPRELLASSGKLEKDVIAVKLHGRTVDLHTPVDATAAELTPIRATDGDGLAVIRHSTAHVMADAVQRLFPGTKVTIGPAIDDGFYYDFDKPGGAFTEDDLGRIEQVMLEVIKKDTPFRRAVVTREEAKSMFSAATTASSARISTSSCSTRWRRRCRSSCRRARSSTTASSSTSASSTSARATRRSSRRWRTRRSSSRRAGTSRTTPRTCTAS
jgi:threonyl-tRNA synthetase